MFVDPSHATGQWDLVAPMSKAAVAAGADGLIIEVHTDPENALSDGPQDGADGCRVIFLHPKDTGGVLIELSQAP